MGVSVHDIQEGLKLMGFSLDDLAEATELGGNNAQATLNALKKRVKSAYGMPKVRMGSVPFGRSSDDVCSRAGKVDRAASIEAILEALFV